jgi:hypothetical protein
MRNQFFYKVKMNEKEYTASLNINKVIRSLANDEGGLIVILDDFNERVSKQPDIDLKTNKMKGFKTVRETVQSEIELNQEDAKRFLELTEYQG